MKLTDQYINNIFFKVFKRKLYMHTQLYIYLQ